MGQSSSDYGLDLPPLNLSETHFSTSYLLQRIFQAKDESAPVHRFMVRSTFLRVVEHAIREYQMARAEVTEAASKPKVGNVGVVSPYIRASSHLETCITSMHRAVRFCTAPRKLGIRLSRAGPDSIRCDTARTALTNFRNAIQHLDTSIYKDTVGAGPISPVTCQGMLMVANQSIPVQSVVSWLEELSKIAAQVLVAP